MSQGERARELLVIRLTNMQLFLSLSRFLFASLDLDRYKLNVEMELFYLF